AEPDEEPDDAAEVGEVDRELVVVDVAEVVEARADDRVRAEPADVPAADAEDDPGQEVEADQATPERRGGRDGDFGHPALTCGLPPPGLGRYEWANGAPPSCDGLFMYGAIAA